MNPIQGCGNPLDMINQLMSFGCNQEQEEGQGQCPNFMPNQNSAFAKPTECL